MFHLSWWLESSSPMDLTHGECEFHPEFFGQKSSNKTLQFSGQIIATENTSFHPKWWFSKGNPLISRKSGLVKYYNLTRFLESCHIPRLFWRCRVKDSTLVDVTGILIHGERNRCMKHIYGWGTFWVIICLLTMYTYIYICVCISVHTKFMGHASSKIDSGFCCVCLAPVCSEKKLVIFQLAMSVFGGLNIQMQQIFMNHSILVYFLVKL